MTGGCHCGAVRVTAAHKPPFVNFCDCSLCAKSGGVWGYYESAHISIEDETRGYRRVDFDEPAVEIHSYPVCGATTHWVTTEHLVSDRMGVNVRVFAPDELYGTEARFPDGRNWTGKIKPRQRRPVGKLGVDAFF